jgi:hypothetical protein
MREYLEGASTTLTNELYDIIDGREQLDRHFGTVDDMWRSLTTLSCVKGDVSMTSNQKSSLRDRSETDVIQNVTFGGQFSGPGGAGKKSLRIQKEHSRSQLSSAVGKRKTTYGS